MTNVAVIGAGVMGSNHARVAAGLGGVTLVAVVDPDLDRAKALAGPLGAIALATLDELWTALSDGVEAEAAIVATPTAGHVATARTLIDHGVGVLVEKPLAA